MNLASPHSNKRNYNELLPKLSKRNDEYYTPAYAVKALLPYIKEKSTIWCPFDKQWSEFVES